MIVSSTPVELPVTDIALIQNLGPGTLYVGRADDVNASEGLQLNVGRALSIDGTYGYTYGVGSGGDCDVRILRSGQGIFAAAV